MHPYVYHTPVLDDTRPEKPGTHATEELLTFTVTTKVTRQRKKYNNLE